MTLPKPFDPLQGLAGKLRGLGLRRGSGHQVGKRYEKLTSKGIFAGPYMYEKSDPERRHPRARPDYSSRTQALTGIDLRKVTDEQAGMRAVANGEADMQLLPAIEVKRLAKRFPDLEYAADGPAAHIRGVQPAPRPRSPSPIRRCARPSPWRSTTRPLERGDGRRLEAAEGQFPEEFAEGVASHSFEPEPARRPSSTRPDGFPGATASARSPARACRSRS